MAERENVALMRRWFEEVWNQGSLATVKELLAPDAVGMGQGEPDALIHGPADFIPFMQRIRGAFPDLKVNVEDIFGSGDKVAVRWSADMTHRGDHLGVPASGERVHITGITIVRIENGQIVQGWDNWDQLSMMQIIGALNSPGVVLVKGAA